MNVLDLPSISDDDELDYELTESVDLAVGNQREKQERAEKFPSGRGEDEAGQQQQPGTTASILSRERKRKQADSLRNSDASDDDGVEVIQHIRREEADEDQDGEKEDDTRQEEVEEEELIKIQGRLAGRVKRIHKVATKRQRKNSKRNLITYDAGGDEEEVAAVDELSEDEEEENFNAERFAQILDGKGDGGTRNLKDQELEDLYASLDVDPDEQLHRFHSLYVTGAVEQMTAFDISRIFAQFEPQNVRPLELSKAFVLTFKNALIAAQLLLDMSKPLRRVRHPKKKEEGELVASSEEDEEEGQVKEEGGEDVAIVKESKAGKRLRRADSDVVEVDVEEVKVPPGKWRVIVSHVPDNKLIYARFATGFELRRSLFIARELERRNNNEVFKCKNAKVRPGLNVFDEKGNELDWDYEHDTRFFDDPTADEHGTSAATATDGDANEGQGQQQSASAEAAQSERPPAQEMETEIAGVKIRSRGRGAKKFMQAFQDSDED